MEGTSAYYNQPMQYGHDNYNVASSAYPGSQQPACIYASRNNNTNNSNNNAGAYGGQSMSVVEQGLAVLNQSSSHINHSHGIPQQALQHIGSGVTGSGQNQMSPHNPTPAHMQNVASSHHGMGVSPLQMPQPPPAHQPQNNQQLSPDGDGQALHGGQKNQGQNLQFPWMKTTKSHAAQWKAQWPGIYLWQYFYFIIVYNILRIRSQNNKQIHVQTQYFRQVVAKRSSCFDLNLAATLSLPATYRPLRIKKQFSVYN